MPQPPMRRGPTRAQVHVDRYALQQTARDHHLSSTEMLLLHDLVLLVDHRSFSWIGTIGFVAEDCRMAPRTASAALARLVELGLVELLSSFGRHQSGEVRVTCYPDLVVLTAEDWRRIHDEKTLDYERIRDIPLSTSASDLPEREETTRNKDAVKEEGVAKRVARQSVSNKPTIGAVRRKAVEQVKETFPGTTEIEPFD